MPKLCTRCKIEKPFKMFYPNRGRKDGYQTICKECKAFYRKNWNKTEIGKKSKNDSVKKYIGQHPNMAKATKKYNSAVSRKKIIKYSHCEHCFNYGVRIDAHHCDYNKPFDVIYLCRMCHAEWHKDNNPLNRDYISA